MTLTRRPNANWATMADIWYYIDPVLGSEFQRIRQSGNLPDGWKAAIDCGAPTYHKSVMPESLVHQLYFYPPVEAAARIREVGVIFPDICCVCARPATRTFPLRPLSFWERFRAARGRWCAPAVPHCNEHGGPFASFLFTILYSQDCILCVAAVGLSREFLDAVREPYKYGDIYPPWIAFPYAYPAIGFTQGENQAWMRNAWRPFWLALPEDERRSYLKRWRAGRLWSEFLLDDPRWHEPMQRGEFEFSCLYPSEASDWDGCLRRTWEVVGNHPHSIFAFVKCIGIDDEVFAQAGINEVMQPLPRRTLDDCFVARPGAGWCFQLPCDNVVELGSALLSTGRCAIFLLRPGMTLDEFVQIHIDTRMEPLACLRLLLTRDDCAIFASPDRSYIELTRRLDPTIVASSTLLSGKLPTGTSRISGAVNTSTAPSCQ